MRWILIFAFGFWGPTAFSADQLKVLKVKGRRAIVVFPKGLKVSPGQILSLKDNETATLLYRSPRSHFVIGQASYVSQKQETKSTITTDQQDMSLFHLEGSYGWNFIEYEIGPELSYNVENNDGAQATSIAAGGFYHYNFSRNIPGAEWVPYAGPSLSLVSLQSENTKFNGWQLTVDGGAKYFPFNDSLSFIGEAQYRYSTTKSDSVDRTISGFALSVGLGFYY